MAGKLKGRLAAWIVMLTWAAAGCKYDKVYSPASGSADSTGRIYPAITAGSEDNAALSAVKGDPQVIAASGDLTQALAAFRAILGDPLNKTAGEQAGGRREVNWDGVPAALTNVDSFPADFFNRVVPRGQIYSTEGTGFRVSDNALADLNRAYAGQFAAFSPPKIFIAVGSRAMTVHFVVAGSTTPARVSGFGVVFSDVDIEQHTGLAFFDAQGELLKRVRAPARSDAAGFSFVGVTFNAAIVATVRIESGQTPITGRNLDISAGGHTDLVAMDDFISGEPHPIQ